MKITQRTAKVNICRQTRVTKSGSKLIILEGYGQIGIRDKNLGAYIGQHVIITITTQEDAVS